MLTLRTISTELERAGSYLIVLALCFVVFPMLGLLYAAAACVFVCHLCRTKRHGASRHHCPCIVLPLVLVGMRNYRRWRERGTDAIRQRSSALAAHRLQQEGELSPSGGSPGGPVGAPRGGGRPRGSRLMGAVTEVLPEPTGGLSLTGKVLP